MTPASAHLPDAFVRLLPIVTEPIQTVPDTAPDVIADGHDVFVVQVERVEQFPENIVLQLCICAVADPDGPGAAVAVQMIEGLLLEVVAAIDSIKNLQCARSLDFTGARFQPFHEGLCLVSESDS